MSYMNLILNAAILIAGLIAINKLPVFTTKLNKKKIKGKNFARLGLIFKFGSTCINILISIILSLSGAFYPYALYIIMQIIGYAGIAFLVCSAILCYQGTKESEEEGKGEEPKPKKATLTANEDMSQKAQYAYTNFRNEYEHGTGVIDEVTEAKLFAKAVELQLLKTPASAVFCAMEEMSVLPIGEDAYSVSGYVDSQNSYGAMLRNQFNLTVFKDENGIWKNANRFVSTAASVNSNIISSTIIWWVLGIIGTIITLAVSYAFTSSMF